MTVESLAKHFSERLSKGNESNFTLLAIFFCSAFQISLIPEISQMFNKLVRMYGEDAIFSAILDAYDMAKITNTDKPQKMYALLSYFAKNKVGVSIKRDDTLVNIINENKLRQQELRETKLIIPNPFAGEDID